MENTEPFTHQNPPTQPLVPDLSYAPDTPPVAAKPAASMLRRKPLLAPEDDAPVVSKPTATSPSAPPVTTSYMVKTARPANQRRGKSIVKLLALVFLCNLLLIGAFAAWYYNFINDEFDQRFNRHLTSQTQAASDSASPATDESGKPQPNAASNASPAPPPEGFLEKITDLQSQVVALQKRLLENEQATKSLANSSKTTTVPSAIAIYPGPSEDPTITAPANVANAAPIRDDLIILKERNRLTSFADEAIATAAREPYERLWKSLDDPRLANLVHATRAEILRVQNYYLSGSRLERFDIPVADYYPDADVLRDTQLNDDQLIQLLSNPEHPWQVRLKAANLLGLRRSTVVGDALVKAVQNDQNLDVVKEATFSFEQLTGYRAQLFETDALAAWWQQYNATPPSADGSTPPSPQTKPQTDETSTSENTTPTPPAVKKSAKADKSPAKSDNKPLGETKKTSTPEEPPLPELILPVEKP